MPDSEKLNIAIVGGGIAGLCFAISLAKSGADVDVDIYESTATFSEIGAGMGLWPRVWETMKLLGLEEDLRCRSSRPTTDGTFKYRKSDQAEGITYGESKVEMEPFHRAEFLEILSQHRPPQYRTHFSKRLVNYTDSSPEPIILHFKDGSTATCDLLVGADGIKSGVRRCMFSQLADTVKQGEDAEETRKHVEPIWTGQIVYRSLITREALESAFPGHPSLSYPIQYFGKHKYLITYPVSQGRIINAAALISKPECYGSVYDGPWVAQVAQEDLKAEFVNWESRVQTLLDLMKSPSKWVINSVDSLPSFVSGRVALIGDAAHAMTPHQASGAGQAVEDGFVLASLLAQPEVNRITVAEALKTYDEVRRPFAQDILQRSLRTGEIYFLQCPQVQDVTLESSAAGGISENTLLELNDDLGEILRWTWTTSIVDDRERAIALFKNRLGIAAV